MTNVDVDPSRAAKAARALRDGGVDVRRDGAGTYHVRSFSRDASYRVQLGADPSCTCPDAAFNGTRRCKHVLACAILAGTEGSRVR